MTWPVLFDVAGRAVPSLFWCGGSEVDWPDLPQVGDDGERGETVVLLAGHRDQPHPGAGPDPGTPPQVVASTEDSLVNHLGKYIGKYHNTT